MTLSKLISESRLRTALLVVMLATLLTGCQGVQDGLLSTAINFERSRAGLEPARVKVDNIEFALLQGGAEQGDTIFMVHGFAADKDNWLRLARYLSDSYHIIAVDLPGHGETHSSSELDYLIDSQARRLKALLDKTETGPVHFMGNSMGGAIGLRFAAMYPDKLKSLVLLDNAGIEAPVQSELFQLLEQGKNPLIVRQPGDFKILTEFVMSKPPFLPWPLPAAYERRMIERQALNDTIFADMLKSREQIGSPRQINQMLTRIATPTLAIWGAEDRVLHVSSIEVMAKHMPHFSSRVLEGIGHVPMVEAPEQVAEIFREFETALAQ